MAAEFIHQAICQRAFGSDDGEPDFFGTGPFAQGFAIGDLHVLQTVIERRATVTGRYKYSLHFGRLGYLPGQSVLAATTAYYQYVHSLLSIP